MIGYQAKNASAFLAAFDAAIAEIEKEFTDVYRGYCTAAFNYVLRETPQWTGNAVANWNFDRIEPSYRVDTNLKSEAAADTVGSLMRLNLKEKGDPRAIGIAAARALPEITAMRYPQPNVPVCINNAAQDLSGEAYIQMLEDNPDNYLRIENQPGHMVERVRNAMLQAFPIIGPAMVDTLATLQPGESNNRGLV